MDTNLVTRLVGYGDGAREAVESGVGRLRAFNVDVEDTVCVVAVVQTLVGNAIRSVGGHDATQGGDSRADIVRILTFRLTNVQLTGNEGHRGGEQIDGRLRGHSQGVVLRRGVGILLLRDLHQRQEQLQKAAAGSSRVVTVQCDHARCRQASKRSQMIASNDDVSTFQRHNHFSEQFADHQSSKRTIFASNQGKEGTEDGNLHT